MRVVVLFFPPKHNNTSSVTVFDGGVYLLSFFIMFQYLLWKVLKLEGKISPKKLCFRIIEHWCGKGNIMKTEHCGTHFFVPSIKYYIHTVNVVVVICTSRMRLVVARVKWGFQVISRTLRHADPKCSWVCDGKLIGREQLICIILLWASLCPNLDNW